MRQRSAFTIVELLVVMAILLALMALILGGLWRATIAAKNKSTEAAIAALHAQVMTRWESYRSRRAPIDRPPMGANAADTHKARIEAIRELQRYELPERWSDLTTPPVRLNSPTGLAVVYQRLVSGGKPAPSYDYQGAECLYFALTTGASKSGTRSGDLARIKTGDKDGDGWLEFWDGWDQPISFIRWPIGFVSDDMPARSIKPPSENPSPLDPLKVLVDDNAPAGFYLVPLVYSGGADLTYGLQSKANNPSNDSRGNPNDPYQPIAGGIYPGTPDANTNAYVDNIHSHSLAPR